MQHTTHHHFYFRLLCATCRIMRVLGSLSGSKSYLLATLQTTIASRFLPCTSCDATRQLTARSSSWTSQKIRTSYIDYFRDQHRHDYYPPSSIIPPKGSGTFFTNAGMNQVRIGLSMKICQNRCLLFIFI